MPPPETGKQRAARIPLDYFKHPTRLDFGRGWWALAGAVALALGGVATGWLAGGQGQHYYSRGPAAAVHATWDNNCTSCHVAFTPLADEAWPRRFLSDSQAMNQKCEACHAGTKHHESQTEELTCAGCHHDHRGRDASLVRTADADCLRCHRDLGRFTGDPRHRYDDGPPPANVTGFRGDQHPQFRHYDPLKDPTDPGTVKFNHKLHMAKGLAVEQSKRPLLLSDITDEAERERFRRPGQKTDEVQLECASCHQADGPATRPARATGAYMLPISYDNHCKACHPLSFDDALPRVQVPHGEQPPDLRPFLEGLYLERARQTQPFFAAGAAGMVALGPGASFGLLTFGQPERPPLVRPDHPAPSLLEQAMAGADVLAKGGRAEHRLFYEGNACNKCHTYPASTDPLAAPKAIVPTAIPEVWFTRAKFDHAAHRAADCRECHARAYADDPNASTENKDILIAAGPGGKSKGLQLCQQCHAPASVQDGQPRGGARFDCAECHRYHNGDHPLAGLGAKERGARRPGSLAEFLSGSLHEGKAP